MPKLKNNTFTDYAICSVDAKSMTCEQSKLREKYPAGSIQRMRLSEALTILNARSKAAVKKRKDEINRCKKDSTRAL